VKLSFEFASMFKACDTRFRNRRHKLTPFSGA